MPETSDEPDDAPASRPIQRAKAANTKAAILDAAAVVVERDGVAALTLERVADEAGVSKGGLLYHFANKADLVVAMLNRTLDRADDRLAELADAHDGAPGAFAHAYLDYVSGGDHARDAGAVGVFAAAASDDGDLGPFERLLDVTTRPFDEQPGAETGWAFSSTTCRLPAASGPTCCTIPEGQRIVRRSIAPASPKPK